MFSGDSNSNAIVTVDTGVTTDCSDTTVDNTWVEVYDPIYKCLYYYCARTNATQWDAPQTFLAAAYTDDADNRVGAAATAIQSLTRGVLVRRNVQQRKCVNNLQNEALTMEVVSVYTTQHCTDDAHDDDSLSASVVSPLVASIDASSIDNNDDDGDDTERASRARRALLDEELAQIRSGDRFWGCDVHDRNIQRQQHEERLLAAAERFWHRVNATSTSAATPLRYIPTNTVAYTRSVADEALACDALQAQEAQQRRLGDRFWGIEGEEQRERQAQRDLDVEDRRSRMIGVIGERLARHAAWQTDADRDRVDAAQNRIETDARDRQRYMKWFYDRCYSVDDLLDYVWPTALRVPAQAATIATAAAVRKRHSAPATTSSYVFDDLVVQQRLHDGDLRFGTKSLVTIHDPQSAQARGRLGALTLQRVAPPGTTALPKKALSPARSALRKSEDDSEHVRLCPSVHYKRTTTPDPHVPARFNNVPFKPSQLSPTRDILCTTHTKRNRLPALASSQPLLMTQQQQRSSPTRTFTKSQQHASPHPTRPDSIVNSNNNDDESGLRQRYRLDYADDSDRDRVEIGNSDAVDFNDGPTTATRRRDALQQRFEREERPLLWRVFALLDYDNSGTVSYDEVQYALQRDVEVAALAQHSLVLRGCAKQPAQLDALFTGAGATASPLAPPRALSWDNFVAIFEKSFIERSDALADASAPFKDVTPAPALSLSSFHEQDEEQNVRAVFALVDSDAIGVLDIDELQRALTDDGESDASTAERRHKAIAALVCSSKALQLLRQHQTFMDAFMCLEPMDPRGISAEEFVRFCLETAAIALFNGLL